MDEQGRQEDDYRPDMPPLDGADYIINHLFDVGPVVNTGMGCIALRSEHLLAWQQETGIRLSGWEARTLRRLSNEYMGESRRAEKRGCQPPWAQPDFKPEPTAVQLALLALANS